MGRAAARGGRARRHLPQWRPLEADGVEPETTANPKCKWAVRTLCALAYPCLSVPVALAIHGTDWVVWWTGENLYWAIGSAWANALWLWSTLTPLHLVVDALHFVLNALVRWRNDEHSTLLLVLLPVTVWASLAAWLRPDYVREAWATAKAVVTGQGHRSATVLRMVTRRPVARREPQPGDTCPICIDDLDNREPLAYCRWGCGRSIHAECMGQWRTHRNAIGLTECLVCKSWM